MKVPGVRPKLAHSRRRKRLWWIAPLIALAFVGLLVGWERRAAQSVRSATPPPTSGDHAADLLARCLAHKGWAVTINHEDNSIEYRGSPSGADKYSRDLVKCSPASGPRTLSASEKHTFYREEQSAVTCLRRLGQKIPEPPPFSEFFREYVSASPWDAHAFVRVSSENDWATVEKACPQPSLDGPERSDEK